MSAIEAAPDPEDAAFLARDRGLLLASLGLLNSTTFPDRREQVRKSLVGRLQLRLGYRLKPCEEFQDAHD